MNVTNVALNLLGRSDESHEKHFYIVMGSIACDSPFFDEFSPDPNFDMKVGLRVLDQLKQKTTAAQDLYV